MHRSYIRLSKLIASLQGGVLLEDETRHIVLTNQAFCTMFAIPAPPDALVGSDCSQGAEQSKHMFSEPEGFVTRIGTILQERQMVLDEVLFLRDGRVLSRDYVPIDDEGLYLGHLWHYRDITLQHQFRMRAERLLHLETTTKAIMRLFLQYSDLDSALNEAISLLGNAVDVSRAYLFRIRANERMLDNTHEWCAEGVSPEIDNLKGLPIDDMFPSIFPMLTQYDLIAPVHISELPKDLSGVLEPQGIQTVLWIPLRINNRIEGFFGYDETRLPRQWLPEEITAARVLAESYSRALEREQAQHALIEARDQALRTAQLRSQFVANMSHEIRTPMTGIMGMLELLQETVLDQEQAEFANEALASGTRLMTIINEILDFAKLEAGHVVLEAEPIDLRAIVKEAQMTFLSHAHAKGLEILVNVQEEVPYRVFGDATRLTQVLLNLVGNAVKFTRVGTVAVSLDYVGTAQNVARMCFKVEDTGIGIPLDKQQLIFESFVQADGTITRKYGGTGLGLSICRQLVGLMGGEIIVKSEEGIGSTFSFTLAMPIAQVTSQSQKGLVELQPQKILIIDDQVTARYVLAQQLLTWGMRVSQHSSLPDFLNDRTQPLRYDLLFLRIGLAKPTATALFAKRIVMLSQDPPVNPAAGEVFLRWPIDQSQLYNLLLEPVEAESQVRSHDVNYRSRILIVDDYPNNARLVKVALSDLPVHIDHVEDGEKLLEMLDKERYDLILMDMQMPVIDGLELTRIVRAAKKPYSAIPIIAFTASIMREQRISYLEAGVNDILGKPFSVVDLRTVVERWTHPSVDAST
ncbi:MAG: ATP-binding protein [Chloroflexota bacterium]|nr:ATP-binding protein [Chloroflexota bacterium]